MAGGCLPMRVEHLGKHFSERIVGGGGGGFLIMIKRV
jgi:hypothetical protein